MRQNDQIRKVLLGLCIALVCSGCGKKQDVSGALESLTEGETISVSGAGTEVFSMENPLNVPKGSQEHMVLSDAGDRSQNVSYFVDDPGLTSGTLPIYKLEKAEVDDAYLTELASKLFDAGQYMSIKPASFCTGNEAEQEKTLFLNTLYDEQRSILGKEEIVIGQAVNEQLRILERILENEEEDTGTDVTSQILYTIEGEGFLMQQSILIGKFRGDYYMLRYSSMSGIQNLRFERMYDAPAYGTSNYDDGVHSVSVGRYRDGDQSAERLYPDGNQSDRTSCEAVAKELLSRLGKVEYSCAESYQLTFVGDGGERYMDGYEYLYMPGTKEVSGKVVENQATVVMEESRQEYPLLSGYTPGSYSDLGFQAQDAAVQDLIVISFVGDKLNDVRMDGCYSKITQVEENAKLLSFDKIDQAVVKMAKSVCNYSSRENGYLPQYEGKHCVLKYLTIRQGDAYRVVPAWVFYSVYGNTDLDYGWGAINALDGSAIQFMYRIDE